MVDMIVLQTASYLIAALSFAVTGAYYIINLRNTSKAQELQVTMQVVSLFSNSAFWDEYNELLTREWKTLEEYQQKYGSMFNFGHTVFITFEAMGVLLRQKLINPIIPWNLYGHATFVIWEKYKPVIMELRRTWAPDAALWTEYFVREMKRYGDEHPESEVFTGLK